MAMTNADIKKYIISVMGSDYLEVEGSTEIRYKCPFCEEMGLRNDDHKLYINYSKRKATVFFCQRCESSGSLRDTTDPLLIESNADEAVEVLLNFIQEIQDRDKIKLDEEEISDYFLIPKNKPIPGTQAWDYMIARGLTPTDISNYNIRVPDLNSERNVFGRFVIPNKVISNIFTDIYCARSYIGDKVRYHNAKSSNKNNIVFNLHNIPDNPHRILLNEGAINSIIAGPDSVATFGKHVTDYQLQSILAKNPEEFYISLDTDARDKAEKLCERARLITDAKIFLVELPEVWDAKDQKMKGLDASDLGRMNYQTYLDNAREYVNKSVYAIENMFKLFQ